MVTIGQLAKQVGMRPSTLRYYEQEGLLQPDGRSEAGYRLYYPEAADRLRLIQRAQRLGFSLADIRTLLRGWETGRLSDEALLATAETRYLSLEKQVTELLVMRHELELFLQDLRQRQQNETADTPFDQLLARVCANPTAQPAATTTLLDWLSLHTGCAFTSDEGQQLLKTLRGRHVHIWQEEDAYQILVVGHDAQVEQALHALAQLETRCQIHAQHLPQLTYGDEGHLLRVEGPNAFIFARLFLALEQELA
jgi:MerR family transcriptional regulator, copper efflux regulator